MSHVLITHMGKPISADKEYPRTTYVLDQTAFETSMLSFGLAKQLQPDSMVFIGTSGSAWSSLISMHEGLQHEDDLQLTLEGIESDDNMVNADLKPLQTCLAAQLNCTVYCRVVPYLETSPVKESAHYLKTLAEVIKAGDDITLDITHGLRYHPMLALVAAQYLKVTLHANIKSILYGNYERKTAEGHSLVMHLNGMLEIMDWVGALNSFDKDGDYSIFSELMHKDGVDPSLCSEVEKAGFFERTTNSVNAKQHLTTLKESTIEFETTPLTSLFSGALSERTEWAKTSGRGNNEFQLAELYLERGDYLRAAIFAQEGYISKQLHRKKDDLNDFDIRKDFNKNCKVPEFIDLREIRNSMAHGLPGKQNMTQERQQKLEKALKSQIELEKALKGYIKALKQN
jgi:CRISPR-associated Csx2 family protein